MITVAEILRDVGIETKSVASCQHFTTCPQCSASRKKKKHKCLSVLIDERGVVWYCWHCHWSGGRFYDSSETSTKRCPKTPNPTKTNGKNTRLALAIWSAAREPRGTLVEQYLKSRGLTLPAEIAGRAIRYDPELYYGGSYTPGMVALFRDIVTNEPRGIHRTFLDPAGRKLDRLMLGREGARRSSLMPMGM